VAGNQIIHEVSSLQIAQIEMVISNPTKECKKMRTVDKHTINSRIFSKIGIIGDIHAENMQLTKALDKLSSLSVEIILSVGDIVDGDGDAEVCCDLLHQNSVIAVRGNHDQWFLSNQYGKTCPNDLSDFSKEFLAKLPVTQEIQTTQGCLLLCHGIGEHDMARITADDYGYSLEANYELQEVVCSNRYVFMVNGHTHRNMVRKFNQLTIINAGSLISTQEPIVSVLDTKMGSVQFFSIGDGDQTDHPKTFALESLKSEPLRKFF
jgi:putative phosphoesterase